MKNKEWVCTVYGRIPSKKNSRRIVGRGSRRFELPSEAYQLWEDEQIHLLKVSGLLPEAPIQVVRSLRIEFRFPDNRRADLTNKAESIMDMITKIGVIQDDNWKIVPCIHLIAIGVDKDNPRAIITVNY